MDITQDTFTPLGATEKYNWIAKSGFVESKQANWVDIVVPAEGLAENCIGSCSESSSSICCFFFPTDPDLSLMLPVLDCRSTLGRPVPE